jgi:pyrimidine operon attenuation protein/uracil phosphoribosyltransferase
MRKKILVEEKEFLRIIDRLASEILEKHPDGDIVLIGIHTRGVYIAQKLKKIIEEKIGKEIPLGTVDITFYRDDLKKKYEQPEVKETKIPFSVEDKKVVLVDDVIYTGRTVRCAIDEIMDYGRPQKIELLVMADRGHRELPIHPDYVGRKIPTSKEEIVDVLVKEIDGKNQIVLKNIPKR